MLIHTNNRLNEGKDLRKDSTDIFVKETQAYCMYVKFL